jgi:hypothetical protein
LSCSDLAGIETPFGPIQRSFGSIMLDLGFFASVLGFRAGRFGFTFFFFCGSRCHFSLISPLLGLGSIGVCTHRASFRSEGQPSANKHCGHKQRDKS